MHSHIFFINVYIRILNLAFNCHCIDVSLSLFDLCCIFAVILHTVCYQIKLQWQKKNEFVT